MKKTFLSSAIALIFASSAFAQPVSDRVVIPIAVTLNQILRIHVTNGGNIEFVFNTIDDYKNGIPNQAMYQSDLVVASSTDWSIDMGSETFTWDGTDDPANIGLFDADNVGFTLDWTGGLTCCGAALNVDQGAFYTNSVTGAGAPGTANGLAAYSGPGNEELLTVGSTNAGDVVDNTFSLLWECGTVGAGTNPMNAGSILSQNIPPDRYVGNVLIDLVAQ